MSRTDAVASCCKLTRKKKAPNLYLFLFCLLDQDMAARHRARFRSIHIIKVAEVQAKDVRRPYITQFIVRKGTTRRIRRATCLLIICLFSLFSLSLSIRTPKSSSLSLTVSPDPLPRPSSKPLLASDPTLSLKRICGLLLLLLGGYNGDDDDDNDNDKRSSSCCWWRQICF